MTCRFCGKPARTLLCPRCMDRFHRYLQTGRMGPLVPTATPARAEDAQQEVSHSLEVLDAV